MTPPAPKSPFDAAMTYILEDILTFTDTNHAVRKSLNARGIYTYETFRNEDPTTMHAYVYEQAKATSSSPAIMSYLTTGQAHNLQSCNAYARFLEDDGQDDASDDPRKWDLRLFGKWRRKECIPYLAGLSTVSTATPGAPIAAMPTVTAPTVTAGIRTQATTLPAPTAPAPVSTTTYQKIDDDSLTGWKRKNLNIADYPKLTNDTNYVPWKIKFTRQVSSHFWFRLIDLNFSTSQ